MALGFQRTPERPARTAIRVLDRVRLREAMDAEGYQFPAGAEGTAVLAHRGGEAFEVEFTRPFHAVVGIPTQKLSRI
jgi:hypothetical protein